MLSEDQKRMRDLVNRCISYADRKGTFDASRARACNVVELVHEGPDIKIHCSLTSAGHAPSRYEMSVRRSGEIVLEAHGTYSGGAMDAITDRYVPGEWEGSLE